MPVYLDILVGLNFLVDLLLLIGADRLSGHRSKMMRYLAAAGLGAVYGGACVLPGLRFLSGTLWRLVSLGGMGWIAFGSRRDALRRSILFTLLSMALGGIALCLQSGGIWGLVISVGMVFGMCLLGFRGRLGERYLSVQIRTSDQIHRFTALLDTGNGLKDPLTGQQILVVSGSIGQRLTGLSKGQMEDPASVIGKLPGIRLIPFSAVGRDGGLMAAKRFEDVTIGRWHGSMLVAFAPNELGVGQPYEALTGGTLG